MKVLIIASLIVFFISIYSDAHRESEGRGSGGRGFGGRGSKGSSRPEGNKSRPGKNFGWICEFCQNYTGKIN